MIISKSERFNILEQELNSLRANFLPARFDSEEGYSPKEIALATAYRVLAHAEIESYLEERALDIVQNALTLWNSWRHGAKAAAIQRGRGHGGGGQADVLEVGVGGVREKGGRRGRGGAAVGGRQQPQRKQVAVAALALYAVQGE